MKFIHLRPNLKIKLSTIYELHEFSYLELCLGKKIKQLFVDTCPYLKLSVDLGLGM
jgi:hypothetical protein